MSVKALFYTQRFKKDYKKLPSKIQDAVDAKLAFHVRPTGARIHVHRSPHGARADGFDYPAFGRLLREPT